MNILVSCCREGKVGKFVVLQLEASVQLGGQLCLHACNIKEDPLGIHSSVKASQKGIRRVRNVSRCMF